MLLCVFVERVDRSECEHGLCEGCPVSPQPFQGHLRFIPWLDIWDYLGKSLASLSSPGPSDLSSLSLSPNLPVANWSLT